MLVFFLITMRRLLPYLAHQTGWCWFLLQLDGYSIILSNTYVTTVRRLLLFPAQYILRDQGPWRWKQHCLPKRWYSTTSLQPWRLRQRGSGKRWYPTRSLLFSRQRQDCPSNHFYLIILQRDRFSRRYFTASCMWLWMTGKWRNVCRCVVRCRNKIISLIVGCYIRELVSPVFPSFLIILFRAIIWLSVIETYRSSSIAFIASTEWKCDQEW